MDDIQRRVLLPAEPLPAPLADAARVVARGRTYGDGLEVLFASRLDQVHFKLYATADQGAGKHLDDLQALEPTADELLAAARWSLTHDPSQEVVPFAVELGGGGPVISERLRA